MKARKKKMQLEDLAELIKKGFDELDTRAAARAEALVPSGSDSPDEVTHTIAHLVEWLEELEERVTALEDAKKLSDRG